MGKKTVYFCLVERTLINIRNINTVFVRFLKCALEILHEDL